MDAFQFDQEMMRYKEEQSSVDEVMTLIQESLKTYQSALNITTENGVTQYVMEEGYKR